jgi:hypothetical protein
LTGWRLGTPCPRERRNDGRAPNQQTCHRLPWSLGSPTCRRLATSGGCRSRLLRLWRHPPRGGLALLRRYRLQPRRLLLPPARLCSRHARQETRSTLSQGSMCTAQSSSNCKQNAGGHLLLACMNCKLSAVHLKELKNRLQELGLQEELKNRLQERPRHQR